MSESKCIGHDLVLPRWDIYICDHCGRQLAFLEKLVWPGRSSFWSILVKTIKRVLKHDYQ